jgi:hypothetical protein
MEKSYRGVMHGAGSFALALVPKELVALGLLMLLTVIGCALLLWTLFPPAMDIEFVWSTPTTTYLVMP